MQVCSFPGSLLFSHRILTWKWPSSLCPPPNLETPPPEIQQSRHFTDLRRLSRTGFFECFPTPPSKNSVMSKTLASRVETNRCQSGHAQRRQGRTFAASVTGNASSGIADPLGRSISPAARSPSLHIISEISCVAGLPSSGGLLVPCVPSAASQCS